MDDKNIHAHEWVVFSTALKECWLMLQCAKCGAMGTVDDPTKEEWSEAFHAPTKPYRWTDEARVHVRHEPPFPSELELTGEQLDRQDAVESAIFGLLVDLAGKEIEFDTELIGSVRDTISKEFDQRGIMNEMEFYPYMEG